jgi:hypothetical protein
MGEFKIKFNNNSDDDFNSIYSDKKTIEYYLTQIDNRLGIVNIKKINNPDSVFEDTKFILNKLSLQYKNEIQDLIQSLGETKYRCEKSFEKDNFFNIQTICIIRKSFYKRQYYYFKLCILLIFVCIILYILYILYLIMI